MSVHWDCIIIGGGAAGLWAAGTVAQRGRRVLVLEKNTKAGVKILMSGGTRCNITHACSARHISEAFGPQGRFLLSPLSRLSPDDVVQQFHGMGVETKVEETGKVFPVSNKAIDVRDALVRRLEEAGGAIRTGMAVTNVGRSSTDAEFVITMAQEELRANHVLITTGGLSFSGCGTTGDGYAWLRAMGHTITDLRPALTPILSPAAWVHELSGITLDDASVTAMPDGKMPSKKESHAMTSRGGFLWTHFGCSGPTAMNVSKYLSDRSDYQHSRLAIDVLPEFSEAQCLEWLDAATTGTHSQKQVANLLAERLPKRLITSMLINANVGGEIRMAELSKRHRVSIVERLKRWQIPVCGTRGYPKAEVTAGGVALSEVDSKTMESRLVPGLFLAGEILDLDGPIGGYNFQAAWSTGHTAGESM
jgi:predicted Rossmann fold flavoprotein